MRVAYLIEPPFNFRDAAGAVTGCDVELARMVFRTLGRPAPTFVETEFADLLPGLARGDWQMTTGLFATEDRRAHALFSRPIWALPDGLLIRAANVGRITGYRSLAADQTCRLAVVRDQVQHESALDLGVPRDRIIVFETYSEAEEAVRGGRAAAYASVARAHEGYLEQTDDVALRVVDVPLAEKPPAFGCFAFARSDPDLRNAVDGLLQGVIGSAGHRQLMRGFGFTDAEVDLVL